MESSNLNIWYYVGSILEIPFFALPVTGILVFLFPDRAIFYKNKFSFIFILLFVLAFLSQWVALWAVFGIGLKHVESEGILGILGGQVFLIAPALYVGIFLLSRYLQKRRNVASPSLALYTSLTLSAPLHLFLMEVLEKLVK